VRTCRSLDIASTSADNGDENQRPPEIFIDRDGALFRHILNYMRDSRVILPPLLSLHRQLLVEADFYRLPELAQMLREHTTNIELSGAFADRF